LPLQIVEAQDAGLDVDLEPVLVHLAKAHDVGGEAWDVIDPIKPTVLTGLAREEDGAFALDVDHRAVAEFDSASDTGVQLSEDCTRPHHVVCSAGVKHPAARSHDLLLFFIEVEKNLALDEVDVGLWFSNR
jgi:hypothetical protein